MTTLLRCILSLALTFAHAGCIDVADTGSAGVDGQVKRLDQSIASSTAIRPRSQQDLAIETEGNCAMSVLDEALLEKINEVRALTRLCGDDRYAKATPVVWNCALETAAASHSLDMGENNFFSHTGADGLRVGARADLAGYDWIMVAENIAVGYFSVDDVVRGWLDSPSHCQTIMNESYSHMGAAVHLPPDADYGSYWTLLMGRPTDI